jgi:hypothetical protein
VFSEPFGDTTALENTVLIVVFSESYGVTTALENMLGGEL